MTSPKYIDPDEPIETLFAYESIIERPPTRNAWGRKLAQLTPGQRQKPGTHTESLRCPRVEEEE